MQKFVLMNRRQEAALLSIETGQKTDYLCDMEIINTEYLPFPVRF